MTNNTISTPHPLLRSSRGRVLRPAPPAETTSGSESHETPDDHTHSRQRTSSMMSIETIRPSTKTRKAIADLFANSTEMPPNETTSAKSSIRKRTLSIDDDTSVLPRIRQRLMSASKADLLPPTSRGDPQTTEKREMSPAALGALKRLKEKFAHPREPKPPSSTSKMLENTSPALDSLAKTPTVSSVAPSTDTAQPLQSLSVNTESRRTLPIRRHIPGARLNKYGFYELKASEFELSITAPSPARGNFEVWDQQEELFLIGPLSLQLLLKDPAKWDGLPITHPDISVLELACMSTPVVDAPDFPYTGTAKRECGYAVCYTGATFRTPGAMRLRDPWPERPNEVEEVDPAAGITVDTVWMRSPSVASSDPAWELHFVVPIATALFERRETRAFRVQASVTVRGERLATKGGGTVFSVSHLRREREMDGLV